MSDNKNESQITNLQLVEIDHNRFAVEVKDGNISVNLTKMARPFGKFPKDWLITKEAKDYLEVLSVSRNLLTADLTRVIRGGTPDEQGTWAFDYRIAMRFAQWLSPEFSIAVDELLVNLLTGQATVRKNREIPETASSMSEETLITVPMGSSINQIWVSGGVIYARLTTLMRFVGYKDTVSSQRIGRLGASHFRKVRCGGQETWFVDIAGFNALLEYTGKQTDSRTLRAIYRMYGITEADNLPEYAYCFTEDEMYNIQRAANRRPYNRADLLDLLWDGRKEGGVL